MNKPLNLYDSVAIGVSRDKAKVYHQVSMKPGDTFNIGTAFSSCDKVILDIKVIAKSRISSFTNSTKESTKYYLNENNPFDIIPGNGSLLKSVSKIKNLISYNRSNNILEINTRSIFDKGFFNFSIKLNFTSSGITRGKIVKQKPIIKIETSETSKKLFDGLQVKINKANDKKNDALVIDEFKRFSQSNLFNFKPSEDNFGFDNVNVEYLGSGEFKFDESINIQSILIKNSAKVKLPNGYPVVSIYDRFNSPRMTNGVNHETRNPKLYSTITHNQYLTKDSIPFFDQVVRRTLVGENDIPRDFQLVSIRDVFGTVEKDANIPILHFRREYSKKEDVNNGKAPYHFYFCPKYIRANDNLAECFSFELNRSIASGVDVEISCKTRSLSNVSLESKITVNNNGSKKIFYGSLNLNIPKNSSSYYFEFGKSKVFHSDSPTSVALNNSVYGISVMDIFNAIKKNYGGNVNINFPTGSGSSTHRGFIPTFEEIGLSNPNPESPIVTFFEGKDYRACALIAAARLWNGNEDGTNSSARKELINVNVGGRKIRNYLMCRGLSNDVDLSNFVGVAPLCRALTTAFVRGEIKSFSEHVADGDFVPLEMNGPGYNRFYKYDTIRKSIDVMSFGESYFSSILNLENLEVENMVCGGPATSTMGKGELRKLFGASQIGVAFDFLGDKVDGEFGGFFENTPAYMMSHLGLDSIGSIRETISKKPFVKKLNDFSGSSSFISISYKHNPMFPGPNSYAFSEYVPSPVRFKINEYGEDPNNYYNGGIFHVLYTTSGKGGHVKDIKDLRGSENIKYATTLDPFNFDNKALLICEGGDEKSPPKRRIVLNERMQWLENAPEKSKILCAFLLKEITDWGSTRNWKKGKSIKFSFDSTRQNNYKGTLSLTGNGTKDILSFVEYDTSNKTVSYFTNTGESKFIDKTVQSFYDAHKNTFSGIIDIDVSGVLNATAEMPYEDLIFDRIPINALAKKSIYDFVEPYVTSPYSENINEGENPYSDFNFNSSYFNFLSNYNYTNINPYENLLEPYSYIEPYHYIEPYLPKEPAKVGISGIYISRTVIPQTKSINFKIDFLNKNNYPRSYQFYLNNPKYNSIEDLVNDVNNRMSDLGVSAVSLVSNPKAYSVQRLAQKETSTIIDANYKFVKFETYFSRSFQEPYSGINPELESPYSLPINPYYSQENEINYKDLEPTSSIISNFENQDSLEESSNIKYTDYFIEKTKYVENFTDSYLPYSYISEYSFTDAYQQISYIDQGPSFSGIGEIKFFNNIITANLPVVTYERVRTVENFDSIVEIDYDLYDEQYNQPENIEFKFVSKSTEFKAALNKEVIFGRPREVISVSDLPISDSVSFFYAPYDESRFLPSDQISHQYSSQQTSDESIVNPQTFALTTGSISGLEVAYGGYLSSNSNFYNPAPNTYFSNSNQTGLGNIEFRTVDADYAILLVRVAHNDGTYGPANSAANSIKDSIRANVSYNSGAEIEFVQAEWSNPNAFENTPGPSGFYPLSLKIPLKSSLNYVSIFMDGTSVSASAKIIDAPSEINNFGFLAINKNNPNYDMISSKDGRTFGLVLDNYGFWDILIAPEASLSTVSFGDFSFNGRGYSRAPGDTDDKFIAGIGNPVIDANNDIESFDKSMIPSAVRNSISIIPVPGYQQVWVLRIDPSVKSYLSNLRRTYGNLSQDGCFVDIPIYFQAAITEASGTCNIRIFNNVNCVFDYNFCDFFWNLGSPLQLPDAFSIDNSIRANFEEYILCDNEPRSFTENEVLKFEITSYFMMNIQNIPMLDNGNALLMIKSDTSGTNITEIFSPSVDVLNRLKNKTGDVTGRPWEFTCEFLSNPNVLNKTTLYNNPLDYNSNFINSVDIASRLNTEQKFLLVQPKFKFPPFDEFGAFSPSERVIASLGFTYKNWKPASTETWDQRMMFGIKFVIENGQQNPNLSSIFSIRFLYNEDRKLL